MNSLNTKIVLVCLSVFTIGSILFQKNFSAEVSEFDEWKTFHKISYASDFQNNYRRKVLQENRAKIIQHNSNPKSNYKMGLNQFSAMTDEEFQHKYLSVVNTSTNQVLETKSMNSLEAITDIDWVKQGAVGPVKNQGQCSASWIFSTTAPLQGLTKIADGSLKILSDQQLIDCTGAGCNGGYPESGFKYVKLHGISTANQYPYHGSVQTCKKPDGSFKIAGYTNINNCNDLSTSIHKGPVSVIVDASNWSRYASGIFSECGTSLNHAVTLVGQIQQNWKVQNSWGSMWGQNGFIRLAKGNTCGICQIGILPFK